ncbi:MAG: acyl--CoA ligase [Clostridiaceae bacterium]|nr:acyl--CoA ligase [Clostridiaceae bacterium]
MKQYPLYPADRYDDFASFLEGIGMKFAVQPAITVFQTDGTARTHTYADLSQDAKAVACYILSLGLKGQNIAILGETSYEYLVAMLGVSASGNVIVPIDCDQATEALYAAISYADAALVIRDAETGELLLGSESIASLPHIALDNLESVTKGVIALGKTLPEVTLPQCAPDDVAAMFYTSGTTSNPKLVMLTHKNILWNAHSSISAVRPGDQLYIPLPLYHTYGYTSSTISTLSIGSHLCICGDTRYLQRDALAFDPQGFIAVPLIAESLYNLIYNEACSKENSRRPSGKALKKAKASILPSLTTLISGGAGLPLAIEKGLRKCGIDVLQGYGITECSPLISVNRNQAGRIGTSGPVIPGMEVKIDRKGAIWVRGDGVMKGYYKNPELTESVFDGEWFETGDLGSIDKAGYLRIKGREKKLIVLSSGKKVLPEELEEFVNEIGIVKEVVVYGVASGDRSGEILPAVSIYADPVLTSNMSQFEILDALQKEIDKINLKLPNYKQIRFVNIRDSAFPKTPTGKIRLDIK